MMGRADLHMHTTASDGIMTVKEVLEHVKQRGNLDVIAITDHDRIEASLWAYEHQHLYPFEIVPGVEVTSAHGHVLGLWVTAPIPSHMSLQETAHAIHEQGGIAVLAHPFHIHMHLIARAAAKYVRNPEMLACLDGLEIHNAAVFTPGSNRFARFFCNNRLGSIGGLAALGNSDAHTLGAIGTGQTLFAGKTAAELRAAIEAKKTTVEGTTWALRDYRLMITDLIQRRGNPHPKVRRSVLTPE